MPKSIKNNTKTDLVGLNSVSIQIKVEKQLKFDATTTLDDLGLSLNDAVKLFLKQVINTGTIPFEIKPPKSLLIDSNDDTSLTKKEKDELTKIIAEYKSGNNRSVKFENIDEIKNYLNNL